MINPRIFRQYDIRGLVNRDLNESTIFLIGKAFGTYLKRKKLTNLVIGGDARLSTPHFKEVFTRALIQTGIDVIDIGTVATPVLYYAIWKLHTDAGVMITASHNPAEYNGIKLNEGLTSFYGEQIQHLLQLIKKKDFDLGQGQQFQNKNVNKMYINHILNGIELARPVKVVIDAGNGVGGPYLPLILEKLGCDVTKLYCEPDGTFPNHHPDPTVEKYMADMIAKVKEVGAEAGLGLDGDADRLGVIDENGRMLYGDQILNIIARDFLKNNPGEKIIADVKCSKNLFDDIEKHGGIPIMYKTGHANIKSKMQEEGILVSGEMSGHIFLKDRYLGFDDAIYVACRFVEIMSKSQKPVSRYLEDQPKMYITPEIHIKSNDDDKFRIVEKVRDSFIEEGYEVNAIDGIRMTFPDGWGLCRASNTTPVLVVRFEAETQQRLEEIKKLIEDRIKSFM